MADRSTTCSSCGKRLNKKSWYYRNGQYFCKKRCWETAKAKAQEQTNAGAAATPSAAPNAGEPATSA